MIARMGRTVVLGALCLGGASAMLLLGNQQPDLASSRVPLVQDWTHRHMVYSHPQSIGQNLQLQQQPRYVQQVLSRNFIAPPAFGRRRPVPNPINFSPEQQNDLYRDWQQVMPAGGYTMGDGNFPAKYTFNVNAPPDCVNDFVVFTTNQGGAGATLDIYGLNNLYTGICTSGTVPSTLWAYHVRSHAAGRPIGSPVLSLDGTQIAWIEGGSGQATLHILKPYTGGGAGTLTAAATPVNSATAAAYRSCTPATGNGACLFSINFGNANDDTTSSAYYDYSDDTIYVGDAGGNLHAFTGIFKGSPAEATTGGWPVAVHAGDALTGPVYDTNTQHVFVGDNAGRLSYVAVTSPFNGALGGTSWTIGTSITDAPIVDGTIGRVFVFANDTGTGALVGEADTSLGTHTGPVIVGSSTTSPFHSGDFDNLYYNSDTGAGTGTGFLYVCGNNGAANHPDLYQIPVTSGTIGLTATSEFVAATASVECSPVTEFYNTTTSQDSIFFSVHNNAAAGTDCATHGCLFAATLGPNGPAETVTISGAILASGGTSGVVVDNNSSTSGASNIYYSWLGNSSATFPCTTNARGCTVQVSQLGLGSAGVVVNGNAGDSGASLSETSDFSSAAKNGDLILIFSHWDGAGITATATDNGGNTYTALGPAINIGSNNWIQAWYAGNILGTPNAFKVTYSAKTTSISLVDAIEYSGLATVAPFDTTTYKSATGTGTALSSGASGVTTADNETIIGLFATVGAAGFPFTLGPGYSQDTMDATSLVEHLDVSVEASYTASATGSNSTSWGAIVFGFKNALQ